MNSHLSRGFDPFKTLSINTNTIESSVAAGNVVVVKKPGVLYESLQHHPLLHQSQIQQQQIYQQTAVPKTTIIPIAIATTLPASSITSTITPTSVATTNPASISAVDGHRYSRMEIHKASLATTTTDHQTNSSK